MSKSVTSLIRGFMRVLVLGATGYLGQFLVRALAARDDVELVAAASRAHTSLPIDCLAVDLADDASVRACLERARPDLVVNCAAIAALGDCERDPARAMAVNCPATLVHALATATPAPFLVHFSTDIVFSGGDYPDGGYDEESPAAPLNAYARSKAAMDALLASSYPKQRFLVLRPTNILGPPAPFANERTKFLQWLVARLRGDQPVPCFCDEFRSYVWVQDIVDAVDALVTALTAGRDVPTGVLNACGPAPYARDQIAEALATHPGLRRELIQRVPRASVALGYESPLDVPLNPARFTTWLGRAPTDPLTAIRALEI